MASLVVMLIVGFRFIIVLMPVRYHPRFFDQVWHQTTYASMGNKHFFLKSCHRQTYQNYGQPPQRLQNLYVLSKSFFSLKNECNLSDFFSVKNFRLGD